MEEKKWTTIVIPIDLYDELTILQKELKNTYGFSPAYWEVVNYLLRFFKQSSKSDYAKAEKFGGEKD